MLFDFQVILSSSIYDFLHSDFCHVCPVRLSLHECFNATSVSVISSNNSGIQVYPEFPEIMGRYRALLVPEAKY